MTDKLYKEESEYGKIHEKKEWFELQKKLLIDQGFITNTAKLLRSVTLEDQLASLAGAVI